MCSSRATSPTPTAAPTPCSGDSATAPQAREADPQHTFLVQDDHAYRVLLEATDCHGPVRARHLRDRRRSGPDVLSAHDELRRRCDAGRELRSTRRHHPHTGRRSDLRTDPERPGRGGRHHRGKPRMPSHTERNAASRPSRSSSAARRQTPPDSPSPASTLSPSPTTISSTMAWPDCEETQNTLSPRGDRLFRRRRRLHRGRRAALPVAIRNDIRHSSPSATGPASTTTTSPTSMPGRTNPDSRTSQRTNCDGTSPHSVPDTDIRDRRNALRSRVLDRTRPWA